GLDRRLLFARAADLRPPAQGRGRRHLQLERSSPNPADQRARRQVPDRAVLVERSRRLRLSLLIERSFTCAPHSSSSPPPSPSARLRAPARPREKSPAAKNSPAARALRFATRSSGASARPVVDRGRSRPPAGS